MESRILKRPRIDSERKTSVYCDTPLKNALVNKQWPEAVEILRTQPAQVCITPDPSPLALACRFGAPANIVQAILQAAPSQLRHSIDSRGTPLHEAIVCEQTTLQVIQRLLRADEQIKDSNVRATLLQDVDGFTPLHLLIRRRFQSHIQADTGLMRILEELVASCPQAVVVPDRGEYEEPPIVYALKATLYAPSLGSADETCARVERGIYEIVRCMLRYAPDAASRAFSGYRGQYAALHSAVFHGRYTGTIELLLRAEASHPSSAVQAALLANTQGELPLHFCAMRGERPWSVVLIAKAAPKAVLQRDVSGLTPFHWLWVRFVSTLLALDEGRRGSDTSMTLNNNRQSPFETNRYNAFTSLEQGEFDRDLQLIKRMDPPVDFLGMRHIPIEICNAASSLHWATHSASILHQLRERASVEPVEEEQVWTRQEVVTSLFWTKVVSLLEAAHQAGAGTGTTLLLTHTAFESPSCPPPIARMVATLFPAELRLRDERGRLPLHCAASRPWHSLDWPLEHATTGPTAATLLRHESFKALQIALELSDPRAVTVVDNENRLVIHHVINTFVRACTLPTRATCLMNEMLRFLKDLVFKFPDSLLRRDGVSRLIPFLQATAVASSLSDKACPIQDELPLSITFQLLREYPAVLRK
jgi:hypothetical protein